MDLKAVVVAKDGPKIVKVQCKTCKKEHGYRPAKGVKDPALKKPSGATAKSPSERKTVSQSVPVEAEWKKLVLESKNSNKINYTIRQKLNQGDLVAHPSFGEGVVTKIIHPDKAEIIFRDDVRVLIHSR